MLDLTGARKRGPNAPGVYTARGQNATPPPGLAGPRASGATLVNGKRSLNNEILIALFRSHVYARTNLGSRAIAGVEFWSIYDEEGRIKKTSTVS